MNLSLFLQDLSGQTSPAGVRTEAAYAQLPFLLLAKGEAPFDVGPGSQAPAQIAACWRQSLANYQLCAFHAVNVTIRGKDFAERVLDEQVRFLNGISAGLGDLFAADIRKLYAIASQPMLVATRDGGELEIPVEWRVAVDALLTSPDSPYRTDQESFSASGAPAFPDDVDAALAEALELAWARASEHFQALVETGLSLQRTPSSVD